MADYVVRVEAASDKAERDLKKIEQQIKNIDRKVSVDVQLPNIGQTINALDQFGRTAAQVSKIALDMSRKLNVGPGAVLNDLEELFNKVTLAGGKTAKTLYGLKDATPTRILGASFDAASTSALNLSRNVATVGFQIFGLTQSVNILKQAFGNFFNETIGREVRLQEALLQTKTTLISTADVIQNGQRLTDPYKALLALEQPIEDTLQSIRRRSLDIAGTTSDAIVSVFGVVAAQIGAVGGSLKDAEDLAISFAGALGTIGMADPVLANQEIRSILSGTIDRNSRLAVMLGLTNEEVAKAKTSAGGLIEFIKKRLEGFEAGQKSAAQQFAGVMSNIVEVYEEVSRTFGKPILKPLLVGLTEVFTRLGDIFDRLLKISANAGQAVTNVATVLSQSVAQAPVLGGFGGKQEGFTREAEAATGRFAETVRAEMGKIRPLISRLISEVLEGVARVTQGVAALAAGFAAFKFEQLKVAATTFANMAAILNSTVVPALQTMLNLYGEFLSMPLVQYLSQVASVHQVLERLGVNSVLRLAGTWKFYQESINIAIGWVTKFGDIVRGVFNTAVNLAAGAVRGLGNLISSSLSGAINTLQVAATAILKYGVLAIQQLSVYVSKFGHLLIKLAPALEPLGDAFITVAKKMRNVDIAAIKLQLQLEKVGAAGRSAMDDVKIKADQTAQSIQTLGQVIRTKLGGALKSLAVSLKGIVASFIKFQLLLFAIQAITATVTEAFGRFQRAKEQATESANAARSLELLQGKYADLGDAMSEAERRGREFHMSIVETRYSQNQQDIADLTKEIERMNEELERTIMQAPTVGEALRKAFADPVRRALEDLIELGDRFRNGGFWNGVAPGLNEYVAAMRELDKLKAGGSISEEDYKRRKAELIEIGKNTSNYGNLWGSGRAEKERDRAMDERAKREEENNKVNAQRDLERQLDNAELTQKAKEAGLKELADYEWSLKAQLFSKTQELRTKEVQLFKEEGEFRISQVKRANALQLEGVEGAAAAGLEAVNNYLETKAKGELELQTIEKNLTIELANLERQVVDYRYEMEKKIAEIRKRAAQYDQQAASGGGAYNPEGGFLVGSTGNSSGPHLDIRGSNREAVVQEAADIIMQLQKQGVEYIELPNAKLAGGVFDVKNVTDRDALVAALRVEQTAHDSTRGRAPGASQNAIDISLPSGTKIPALVGSAHLNGGLGWSATSLATGNTFGHGLAESRSNKPVAGSGGGSGAFSLGQLKGLAMQAGFTEAQASIMAAIAMGESTGNPEAHNNKGNDDSYGLWQINMLGGMGPDRRLKLGLSSDQQLKDPATNARAAKMVFDERGGSFDPWAVYTGGKYKQWLPQAQAAQPSNAPPSAAGGASAGGGADTPVDANLNFNEVEAIRQRWEDSVKRIQDLLRDSAALQQQIINARTLQELEDVAKSSGLNIKLEQYDDQLIQLQEQLKLVEAAAGKAFDSDKASIEATNQAEYNIRMREYAEIIKGIDKLTDDPEERARLTAKFRAELEKDIVALDKKKKKQLEILTVQKQIAIAERSAQEVRGIQSSTQSEILSRRVDMVKAYRGPDADPVANRLLDAELRIELKRMELMEQHSNDLDLVNLELSKFAPATREAAIRLGELDIELKAFAEGMERAREATDAIVGGLKGGISSVLQGGDISEAAIEMSRAISGKFTDMLLDYAFKPMEDMLMEQFKSLFKIENPEDKQAAAMERNTLAVEANTAALAGGASGAASTAANNIRGFDLKGTLRGITGLAPEVEAATEDLGKSLSKIPDGIAKTAFSMEKLETVSAKIPPSTDKTMGAMQQYATGLASVAAAAIGIVGGIQQIKKGGAGNILMGIGSIFTGVAGGLSGLSSAFGSGAARAGGGSVLPGGGKLVGEYGPEAIFPSANGKVMSNTELRDAMRSSSGGSASGLRLSLAFQTTKFMDRDWVDREQLEDAMQRAERNGARRGARDGEARALERLQQSPQTRRRVGI